MVKSMTGFGMCESAINGITAKVEIKSINNRYCDIKVKMPIQSLDILQKIENIILQKVNRGSVSVLVKVDHCIEKISEVKLNEGLLISYLHSLNRLKEVAKLKDEVNLEALIKLKEIFEFNRKDEDEVLWKTIETSLKKALNFLVKSREEEGRKLMDDILKKVDRMKMILGEIEKNKDQYLKEYEKRLKQKIIQLGQDISLSEERIVAEVSILAQKIDISEEIIRLKCHINHLKRIAKNVKPIGRKIDFYAQEIGREINTIGAKSNSQNISTKIIRLKEELEKIKEQSRNIE